MTAKSQPSVTRPKGFRAAGGTCGIKASGKPDLALIVADHPCAVAGVFTTNKVVGAPVIVNRRHIRRGRSRAIVCNSGCANVCNGQQGIDDALEMCGRVADLVDDCSPRDVLVCSTGVIGRPLPMENVRRGIDALMPRIARGPEADMNAATAMMTTDLVPKSALRTIKIAGTTVYLGGISKGSGMIAPNMATMLAFITTDAAIAPDLLKKSLSSAIDHSFNRISVDGDTSTSDTVLLLASGDARNRKIARPGRLIDVFTDTLTDLCQDLAFQIIKDGEGATKTFRVVIRRAKSQRDAERIGRAMINSPLVKTAVHGGDPNWGRIVAAVGRSGAAVKPDQLRVAIGGIVVFQNGGRCELDRKTELSLDRMMARDKVVFTIDLQLGEATDQWIGCDLSREYVAINTDYTT